ncbi:CLUMA_CG009823, isoform A [Clunio marinus]|uniref:Large ribosomal subunit protein bL36m n=1 Tax=Clunio marinus TaxID=568069 RepID=A0A1J1IBP1_9DIPT|nr:CLUMA_CG009823, isoform A [Clunio marinus]
MWRQLRNVSRIIETTFLSQPITKICNTNFLRNFTALSLKTVDRNDSLMENLPSSSSLLQLQPVMMSLERGMKRVGKVKRRCKNCYFLWKDEKLLNLCTSHPRHRQVKMQKKPKNTWILMDATQSPQRAW